MIKKVIYTCLVGDFDNLEEPQYVMKGWDYICFSNDFIPKQKSIWQVRNIPYKHKDKRRLSRYPKLLPHKALWDFDISVYMDSNITILTNELENQIDGLLCRGDKIAIGKHPLRNCIYEEAKICKESGLDNRAVINNQLSYYRTQNFPENFGLFENNVIYRKHNDPDIVELDDKWWELYNRFSQRDQLSLVFLLWKFNVKCSNLFDEGFNIRSSQHFKYAHHNFTLKHKVLRKLRSFKDIMYQKVGKGL